MLLQQVLQRAALLTALRCTRIQTPIPWWTKVRTLTRVMAAVGMMDGEHLLQTRIAQTRRLRQIICRVQTTAMAAAMHTKQTVWTTGEAMVCLGAKMLGWAMMAAEWEAAAVCLVWVLLGRVEKVKAVLGASAAGSAMIVG